jgi:hypothetical protein
MYATTFLLNVILLNVMEPKIGIEGFGLYAICVKLGVFGVEYFYFALKNVVN